MSDARQHGESVLRMNPKVRLNHVLHPNLKHGKKATATLVSNLALLSISFRGHLGTTTVIT